VTEKLSTSSCRSCGADIVWMVTAAGKNMPADADSVGPGDTLFEFDRHVSHFSTCPQAHKWRKKKS